MKAYFVTGTDTEVGKTTVAVAILGALRTRGLRVGALKPAESGCRRDASGALEPADAMRLWRAAGGWQPVSSVCHYRFEPAVAPGVAAERDGVRLDFGRIVDGVAALDEGGTDFALIEGAGGWLVPLGGDRTMADLAVAIARPVLVVARPGLGTINHTLLTIESIRARGLDVAGVVLSAREPIEDVEFVASNREQIEQASGAPDLGCLRYVAGADPDALARAAGEDLLLEPIL